MQRTIANILIMMGGLIALIAALWLGVFHWGSQPPQSQAQGPVSVVVPPLLPGNTPSQKIQGHRSGVSFDVPSGPLYFVLPSGPRGSITFPTAQSGSGVVPPAQPPAGSSATSTSRSSSTNGSVNTATVPRIVSSAQAWPSTWPRLEIPAIGLVVPIVDTSVVNGQWQVAAYAAGHLQGTSIPGQTGNVVLAGHDDVFGSVFQNIGQLASGDSVVITSNGLTYHYVVASQQVVLPTQTSVLNPTSDNRLTLLTCTPYEVDTHRLVVIAHLQTVTGGHSA